MVDYALAVISLISITIAIVSLFLAYWSVVTGRESIDTLNNVHKEIESEFGRIKAINEDTQSLIARITKLFDASEREGLEMVYPNRMEALKEFAPYMKEEKEEILIIGSSLLGLFLYVPGFKDIVQENPKRFKFLLTHPDDSRKREGPEGRDQGVIKGEIIEGIHKLMNWGVPLENIQLYRGSPTVFTIITSTHMLLNPYPYCTEAYRCWCLQVSSKGSIYKQYYEKHFKDAWDSEWIEKCPDFFKRVEEEEKC